MYSGDLIDCFKFEDQPVINQDVDPVAAVQAYILIFNGHWVFEPEWDMIQAQFMGQTMLVCGFQEAWTQASVHFNGASDNFFCETVSFHISSVLSGFSVVI